MIKLGDLVFPGDILEISELLSLDSTLPDILNFGKYKHVIGPGIRYDSQNNCIVVTKFGKLKYRYAYSLKTAAEADDLKAPSSLYLWIESKSKSYTNVAKGDNLLGLVLKVQGQNAAILLDIDSSYKIYAGINKRVNPLDGSGILPDLEFEGATKRNKPELKPGDLVYTQVTESLLGIDPLLTCKFGKLSQSQDVQKSTLGIITSASKVLRYKSEYVPNDENNKSEQRDITTTTDKAKPLKKPKSISRLIGFCWDTSIDHVIKLLKSMQYECSQNDPDFKELEQSSSPKNLLKMIGENYAYEIIVAMNGRIWLRAKTPEQMLKIYNIVQSLKYMPLKDCLALWTPILTGPKRSIPKKSMLKTFKKNSKKLINNHPAFENDETLIDETTDRLNYKMHDNDFVMDTQ